ncbi:LeuA family protein [Orbaceae bacterium ac157xtp]
MNKDVIEVSYFMIFQDNTIRDGMQQKDVSKDIITRKRVLKKLSEINIQSVEIGMCTSHEDLRLLESFIKILRNDQEAIILTRMIKNDIDLVISLQKKFKNVVLKLLVPVSNLHIEIKLDINKNDYLNKLTDTLNYLSKNQVKFEICLEDATRADLDYLFKVFELCNLYETRFVTVADTVGCATPSKYGQLIKNIVDKKYNFKVSAHCHNDLGLGTANSLNAIENGAERVETTFLGIGERAGNVPIDELVVILNKNNICDCPISIKDIYTTSMVMKTILKIDISPMKPLLGENFFIHESGIHQDGSLKDERMYQFILSSDIGENNKFDFSISGISSSKVIDKQFKKLLGSNNESIKEYTNYYRTLSKAIDGLTPEQFLSLYELINIIERKENKNDLHESYGLHQSLIEHGV